MRKRASGRLIGLTMLLTFATFVPQIPHVEAISTLALDGSGYGSSVGGNCGWSQKLTTTKGPDVIVVMLAINDTTTRIVSPPTDTASLSWTFRASQKGPSNVQIFYYYAIASTSLPPDSVAFSLSSGAVATVCQDFGIFGADINAPFDPNRGMPNENGGNSTSASLTYSTYNPNDFLVILQGFCAEGAAGSGIPSGFTFINSNAHATSSNCAANFLQTAAYFKPVSAALSSNAVSWQFDGSNSPFAVIGDAIQSTPGPLIVSVTAGSNVVDVGQLAPFSCTSGGGVPPYAYSWAFGDGTTGTGVSLSHTYGTAGMMNVVCTVTDALGTSAKDSTEVTVVIDPSVTAFTTSPTSFDAGEEVTFTVLTSGGYGALSYSYANLPAGCLSTNSTSLSCYPTSSGNYHVTVTVTDRAGDSTNATVDITVGPQKVLGLPQAIGLAVIFGTIVGVSAIATLSAALALRRKKRRRALTTTRSPARKLSHECFERESP